MGRSRTRGVLSIVLIVLAGSVGAAVTVSTGWASHNDCALRYVAGGDEVLAGKDAESGGNYSDTKVYSRQLLEDTEPANGKLHANGPWCEYNTAPNERTTTSDYVDKAGVFEGLSQQAAAWERDPTLITLTLGRQNDTIVDHVDKCFKQIKDHDFLEANACALAVLGVPTHWDELRVDLTEILNSYRIQQDGNPQLIVAVTGYPNPYPSATSVATKIPGFCAKLQDTIPTCIARWILLPPALVTLDQVVKKLNQVTSEVVAQFEQASQGRFVFVNPYDKFTDHCMEMKVEIKTKVYHPKSTVHNHNAPETNFGCNDTWIGTDGTDGKKSPFFYLSPAVTGVLIHAEQTTKQMGINPNEKGHDCIADLVWEAVKNKLDVPQAPSDAVCEGN